ncbi:MAG: response regulator transcription factor [Clostridia bacterium]|jgi:DNA-binding response OmpR family regulator|nr:response regulator transcription factor [Clostridia bacterium]
MEKILIVDDEQKIREIIKKYAEFEGYRTDEAADGMEAVNKARKNSYDVIIMDIMMPDLDGFSAVKEIRKTKNTPVIMLSARGEEYDRIHGFEVGADDYVVKPFSPKELMMRVGALIKRSKAGGGDEHEILKFGGLTVDFTGRFVYVDGVAAEMTPKEYDLLFYLVRNRGIALSRERLITEVWGYDFFGDDRTLDSHIKLLRKSLGEYSRYVVTLRGLGYRFDGQADQ